MDLKQERIQFRSAQKGEMSVRICEMVDECNCGDSDCCAAYGEEENNKI